MVFLEFDYVYDGIAATGHRPDLVRNLEQRLHLPECYQADIESLTLAPSTVIGQFGSARWGG